MAGAGQEAKVLPSMPLLPLAGEEMNPIKRLWRAMWGKTSVPIPGPLGDAFLKDKKRMQMALSHPAADAMAELENEERGSVSDIPHDQMLYRTSRGLLLTSSMIALGIGAGQYMTAATELKDDEAEELLGNLKQIKTPTPFEVTLMRQITSELGAKWV